jgi:hypothetical protein
MAMEMGLTKGDKLDHDAVGEYVNKQYENSIDEETRAEWILGTKECLSKCKYCFTI